MKKQECRKLVIVEWCEEDKCFHYDDLANSLIKKPILRNGRYVTLLSQS
jgi:hypothetical protein